MELKSLVELEELENFWEDISEEQSDRAEAVLLQASNYLRQIAFNNDVDLDERILDDETGVYTSNVKLVIMSAAQRFLAAPTELVPDATQWSQSASPYSNSFSMGGGQSGSIYFKTRELELLGLNSVSGKSQVSILRRVR